MYAFIFAVLSYAFYYSKFTFDIDWVRAARLAEERPLYCFQTVVRLSLLKCPLVGRSWGAWCMPRQPM